MARGNRRTYEPIASEGAVPGESCAGSDDVEEEAPLTNRGGADAYGRVAQDDDENDAVVQDKLVEHAAEEDEDGEDETLTVVILDFTQKKFNLRVNPSATIHALKAKGATVHKIPADRQRLIYRGKMLADDSSLSESGIVDEGSIVHLFPKPRVVIKESPDSEVPEEEIDENAARVPTIVLDADEAERRSQILVLGSADFLEAQNSVKLFSFMLLIISSIELMSLLAIALGVPQEATDAVYQGIEEDDVFGPVSQNQDMLGNSTDSSGSADASGNDVELRQWTIENSLDLVVSTIGVYVSVIGLKASNETTLRLAKHYLYGTVLAAICWMLFQYLMSYELDKAQYEEHHGPDDDESDADIMQAALSVMVLPGMVWFLCIVRAWQFQYLLQEAEREAEDRIQSELDNIEGPASTTRNGVDEELALQSEHTIS